MRVQAAPILIIAALLATSAAVHASRRAGPGLSLVTCKEVAEASVTYRFQLKNTGGHELLGLGVGYDHDRGETEFAGPHPLRIASPPGWVGRVITLEESDRFQVQWEVEKPGRGLLPGKSLGGFEVVWDQDRPEIAASHWTAIQAGPPPVASARISANQGGMPVPDCRTGSSIVDMPLSATHATPYRGALS